MHFLHNLAGDEEREDDGTEDWLNAIDRSGFWHMDDQVYYSIEGVILSHFKRTIAHTLTDTSKTNVIQAVKRV